MRKVIFILFLLIVLVLGCSEKEDNPVSVEDISTNKVESEDINKEIIEMCDSLCGVDPDSYCEKERTIIVDDKEVTGTCRAFSKKGNIDGFNRCMGFCKKYDKSGTSCSFEGNIDYNCDGIV